MARPRKPPPTAYERRNARARALGYRNYYDYRLHANGRIPPGPLTLDPAVRRRRRGHAGRSDFLRSLAEGDLIILPRGITSVEFDEDARDGEGAYLEIEKLVIHARGGESTWLLRNLTRDELIDTIFEEQQRGAVFSPAPSLDQRRLVTDQELTGGY